MLTIIEALQLPALKGAKLVAGESGKGNPIKWVTTIEIIEDITRFHAGEFVVTTGYGLAYNSTSRKQFLELIRTKILSGIALYTGIYIEQIPEDIIQEANKQNIPLVEIPASINFSTITKGIVEQIGNKQMELLEDSLNIHKEMTKLVLANDGLTEVLAKLSILTDSSLCVFDDMGELLATKNIHHDKIAFANNHLVIENKKVDYLPFLNQEKVNIISENNTGVKTYCFVTPIHSESFTYGYLIAVQCKAVWSEMDSIIMDHVSTLIGIELVKQYAVEETRVRLQGELLEEILLKDLINKESVLRRGKKLGFNLSKSHAVIYLRVFYDMKETEKDWGNLLHYITSKQLSRSNRQFILLPKINELFVLVEVDITNHMNEKQVLKDTAEKIMNRWNHHFKESIMIGIGNAYKEINDVTISAKEAEYAVKYSPLLLKETSIIHFDELGFNQVLIRMQESGISLKHFYETYLGNLIQSKQHRTDLILTLETYLAHNCNMQQTAAHLYIHRHTLKYRLSQIEKRTGISLHSPDDRLNLHLAILAYKFVHLE